MGMFIFAVIALVATIAVFKMAPNIGIDNRTPIIVLGSIVSLALFALSISTIVPPRHIGVVVQFGKPIGEALPNGFHIKSPFANVEKLDASVQNNVYQGDHAIDVRLGNNSEASANVSIQWSLKSDNATELFLDYKTFENIQSNLIDRNLRSALNDAFENYDPLSAVVEGKEDDESAMGKIASEVLEDMRKRVGSQAEIRSVVLPKINYDKATQNRINELQSEIAKTRIAEQKKKTSEAEALANSALSNSLTQEVLISKCLDIISDSGVSPLGCFPGSGAMPTIPVG